MEIINEIDKEEKRIPELKKKRKYLKNLFKVKKFFKINDRKNSKKGGPYFSACQYLSE